MKITTKPAVATVERTVLIEEGPVVQPTGYRRSFRVDTVTIEYTWKSGTFQTEGLHAIQMSGHWVKNDGTPALDRATGMPPSYISWKEHTLEPQYGFTPLLVEMLRPSADLSMEIFEGYEL